MKSMKSKKGDKTTDKVIRVVSQMVRADDISEMLEIHMKSLIWHIHNLTVRI